MIKIHHDFSIYPLSIEQIQAFQGKNDDIAFLFAIGKLHHEPITHVAFLRFTDHFIWQEAENGDHTHFNHYILVTPSDSRSISIWTDTGCRAQYIAHVSRSDRIIRTATPNGPANYLRSPSSDELRFLFDYLLDHPAELGIHKKISSSDACTD